MAMRLKTTVAGGGEPAGSERGSGARLATKARPARRGPAGDAREGEAVEAARGRRRRAGGIEEVVGCADRDEVDPSSLERRKQGLEPGGMLIENGKLDRKSGSA